jgi:hypothetical protein
MILLSVIAAILIAKSVEPQTDSELRPRIVKTIAVNVDDEIDRQWETAR